MNRSNNQPQPADHRPCTHARTHAKRITKKKVMKIASPCPPSCNDLGPVTAWRSTYSVHRAGLANRKKRKKTIKREVGKSKVRQLHMLSLVGMRLTLLWSKRESIFPFSDFDVVTNPTKHRRKLHSNNPPFRRRIK